MMLWPSEVAPARGLKQSSKSKIMVFSFLNRMTLRGCNPMRIVMDSIKI